MLTTLATLAALALAQQTDTTVPVRAGARLEINNFGGEIAVKTWSRNAVRVVAEHSSRDRITVDASDQVVRVKTEGGRRGPSQIDYAVTVPAWMPLNLSGVYTDIKVDGAQNEITAETVQGEITVLGGGGQRVAQVRHGSGDTREGARSYRPEQRQRRDPGDRGFGRHHRGNREWWRHAHSDRVRQRRGEQDRKSVV